MVYTNYPNFIKNFTIISSFTDKKLLKLKGKYQLINDTSSNNLIYFVPFGNYNYQEIIGLSCYKNKILNENNLLLLIKFIDKPNNMNMTISYLTLNQLLFSRHSTVIRFTN